MKKIIILYSTAGLGHKKAAFALAKELETRENVEFELLDINDYATKFYKFLYLDFYVFLMKKAQWLWAFMYYFSNMPWFDKLTCKIRGDLDYVSLKRLGSALEEKSPDAIVTSHFLLCSVAENLKKNNKIRAKMFALVTDYGPHSYWLSDFIDMYFVGADRMVKQLEQRNIPASKIMVTGIAAGEEFSHGYDVEKLKKEYSLDKDKKTVFFMSGGFGVGPMAKILLLLNSCQANIQVIAVCGYNKKSYENIASLRGSLKYPVVLFGFTDKVAELMSVSNIMVTKAGGISVTEALDMKLPMILYGSVPGQETWNEQMLLAEGAAVKVGTPDGIPLNLDKILLSEGKYNSMTKNINRIRRPHAAKDIIDNVLKEIE